MTDNNKKIEEEKVMKMPIKKNCWHNGLYLVLPLLFSIAFIGLFFYTKQIVNKQNVELNKKISALSKQQIQADAVMQNAIKLIAIERLKIKSTNKKINLALKDSPYKTNDWLMQKARYYLELAKINNTWTNDFQTTLNLFSEADDTLQSIKSDEVIEVRKLIAEEKLRVATANKLDITKILVELHAIATTVQNLKIKKSSLSSEPVAAIKANTDSSWQNHLKASLAKLNELIIIRRTDESPMYSFAPKYLAAIYANLDLNIQQIQWAIISRNQKLFNISCQQVIASIKNTFNLEDPHTRVVIEKLENIQSTDLTLTKVNIGGGLAALEKLIVDSNTVNEG